MTKRETILHTPPDGNPDTGPAIPDPPAYITGVPATKPHSEAVSPVGTFADRRQEARMPPGYTPHPAMRFSFDPRLAYELALDIEAPSEIFERYGYDIEQAVALMKVPSFVATIRDYKAEVSEKGITFKLKARVQAEDLLTHSYNIATDPEMPAAVRADLIKWTAQMAELGPRKDSVGGPGGGTSLTLSIMFAGEAPEAKYVIGTPERPVLENEER